MRGYWGVRRELIAWTTPDGGRRSRVVAALIRPRSRVTIRRCVSPAARSARNVERAGKHGRLLLFRSASLDRRTRAFDAQDDRMAARRRQRRVARRHVRRAPDRARRSLRRRAGERDPRSLSRPLRRRQRRLLPRLGRRLGARPAPGRGRRGPLQRPAGDWRQARSIMLPNRAGRSFSAASTALRAAQRRSSPCAPTCSRPCATIGALRSSTGISSTCSAPGSIAAFSCCAGSTGPRRPRSSRRSSATRRCTKSATGTSSDGASTRPTGAVTPFSTRRWSTSR